MTAFQPGSPAYEALIAERDELRAENGRLLGVCRDKTTLLKDAYADNARLRAALEEIASDPTGVSIYQAEIARRELERKP